MSPNLPPRSLLAVPAAHPKFLRSSLRWQASAVMADLEDSAASEAEEFAREDVLRFLSGPAADAARVMVRVNDPMTETGRRDLGAIARRVDRVAAIVIPKSERESVAAVQEQIKCPVIALVETAVGVEEAYNIARRPGVVGMLFGSVDYTAELGRRGGWHASELGWAKSRVVNAATASGVWALAGPRTALDGKPGLITEVEADRSYGFAGKLCIHPAQVAVVNEGFAPSRKQQEWARRVLDAIESEDPGAVRIDGQMIDRPLITQARAILGAAPAIPA